MTFDPRRVSATPSSAKLYDVIEGRKKNPVQGSYTSYLFENGLDKILKKVGEESTEVLIAAKNDRDEFVAESADLIYHLLVCDGGGRAFTRMPSGANSAKRRGGGGRRTLPRGSNLGSAPGT